MADEKTTLETEFEEPVYIMTPHPEARVVGGEKTESPGEPTAADESISDLIQQAVDGLRSELRAELESQADRIQSELQAELQSELKNELKGGSEFNVKG